MSLVEGVEVGAIDLSVNYVGYYTISEEFTIIHRIIITGLSSCDGWLFDCEVRLMICIGIAYKKPKVVSGKNKCQGIASNLKLLMVSLLTVCGKLCRHSSSGRLSLTRLLHGIELNLFKHLGRCGDFAEVTLIPLKPRRPYPTVIHHCH